ncbi:MAG: hypothetical protein IPL89_00005, partial [Acidobacteria bacterium]|nr:hypothetical protein [Acidobacteriota bacterium]
MPVQHDGSRNASRRRSEGRQALVDTLLKKGSRWTNQKGETKQVTPGKILVVAPFNAQVNRLQDALESRHPVSGTVDRFQEKTRRHRHLLNGHVTPRRRSARMEFL